MVEKFGKKICFKRNFGLRKSLVQDRVQDKVQDKFGLEKIFTNFFFFWKKLKMSCLMEILWKKNPFKNNVGLKKSLVQDIFQDKVQDKFGLGKLLPFFFCKSLKMSCLMEILWKNPFKRNFGLKKSLVQDIFQDKVQDKTWLGKFSPISFFCKKP